MCTTVAAHTCVAPQSGQNDQIRNGIQELLNVPSCGDFVNRLLSKAGELFSANGKPTSPLTAFDAVAAQGRVYLEARSITINGQTVPVGGLATGYMGAGTAAIYITPASGSANSIYFGNAATGLHESIHHANDNLGYSDRQLAVAADAIMLPGRRAALKTPLSSLAPTDMLGMSGFWNRELNANCPRPAGR